MKTRIYLIILLLVTVSGYCQEVVTDTIDTDTIAMSYEMEELVITNVKDNVSPEMKKQLAILKRRVLKVYPYAKIAAERLTMLNQNMAKLKTEKEKKKYAKIVEKYLEDEFEAKLKKMSRKDGQILVKLIHRQTGHTTFDLIKEQKSGWKAFWSNRMAKLFSINLKSTYSPANVAEDYYIEGFLLQAFEDRKLVRQAPAFSIDYDAIKEKWLAQK
jgi:ABC-type transporter MlaC component